MIEHNLERSKRELHDMQIILRIQYIILLILLVVSFFFVFFSGKAIFKESHLMSIRMNILNFGLLILVSTIVYFFRKSVFQTIRNKQSIQFPEVKKYRNMYFVQAALFESVCVFSMLVYVLWGHEYSLVLGFVMVLVLRLTYPSDERIKKELDATFVW